MNTLVLLTTMAAHHLRYMATPISYTETVVLQEAGGASGHQHYLNFGHLQNDFLHVTNALTSSHYVQQHRRQPDDICFVDDRHCHLGFGDSRHNLIQIVNVSMSG